MLSCTAAPVDESRAIKIAVSCISSSGNQSFSFSLIQKQSQGESSFYIVKFKPTGFVVVSGDDRFYPVLFYSTESNYDINNTPPGFKMMMDNYSDQLQYAVKNFTTATDEIKKSWEVYENQETSFKKTANTKEVLPLIKTKWAQTYPYNLYCPKVTNGGSGGRTVAGEAAVALAQYLRFYEKPEKARGSNLYELPNYGIVSADFENVTYNWSNMSNTLLNETDTTKINSVAKLIYHSGVATTTNYGDDSSSTSFISIDTALSRYFNYTTVLYYYKDFYHSAYTNEEWNTLIKKIIDNFQPVIYSGRSQKGGIQIFLVDGYDKNNYFHVNWGVGGSFDGYFLSESLEQNNNNLYPRNEIIFLKIPPITKVTLKYPANNSIDFPHLVELLKWEGSDLNGLAPDVVQVAKDSTFQNLISNYKYYYGSYFEPLNCEFSSKYFWKIGVYRYGVFGDESPVVWSEVRCFTTALQSVYKPVPTYPKNNEKNVSLTTGLNWYVYSPMRLYDHNYVQVSEDSLFKSIIAQQKVDNPHLSLSNLKYNKTYYWKVCVRTWDDQDVVWSDIFNFSTPSGPIEISNNYPNPFNKSTTIKLTQREEGKLSVKIFNYLGQEVETLFDNYKWWNQGFTWTPKNLPSGIYYCWIKFNNVEKIIKLNYLK